MEVIFKKLIAKLTGGFVVYTEDFDGEIRVRIAKKLPSGDVMCRSILRRDCVLLDDGTVENHGYVERWMKA